MNFRDCVGRVDAKVFSRSLRQPGEDAETYLRRVAVTRRPMWSQPVLIRQASDVRAALAEFFANR